MNNMYHDAIRMTIQQGGDTDTNACIVGGMIGALVGIGKIPKKMVQTLLGLDCRKANRPRPDFLSVRTRGVKGIHKLIDNMPKNI